MPTDIATDSRYATMTAAEVAVAVQDLLAQYAAEDAARRARNTATLAELDAVLDARRATLASLPTLASL